MGYSISQEQHERLEKNRQDGRLCAQSTGRGGCFSRATHRVHMRVWTYERDRLVGEPPVNEDSVMTLCTRHTRDIVATGMLNAEVTSAERY